MLITIVALIANDRLLLLLLFSSLTIDVLIELCLVLQIIVSVLRSHLRNFSVGTTWFLLCDIL